MLTRLARFSPTANVGLVLLALAAGSGLTGCATLPKQVEQVAQYAEASRDIAVAAHPCLVAMYDDKEDACGDDEECVARVRAEANALGDAYDLANSLWCAVMPGAPGCESAVPAVKEPKQ